MRPETYKRVYETCKSRASEGYKITTSTYGLACSSLANVYVLGFSGGVCAIGACLLGQPCHNGLQFEDEMSKLMSNGSSSDWSAFVEGFDAVQKCNYRPCATNEWYLSGKQLYAQLKDEGIIQ